MGGDRMGSLEAALAYLQLGWSVIPIYNKTPGGQCTCEDKNCPSPGKHPRIPWSEFQKRLPTREEVLRWSGKWPETAVGIVLGKVSGGLAVLDIDSPQLARQVINEKLPCRLESTPRGGVHLFLVETEGNSRSGPLIQGVADLKGEGGLVVVAPSPGYVLLQDNPPLPIPNARMWGMKALAMWGVPTNGEATTQQAERASQDKHYPSEQKGYEILAQKTVGEGGRNDALTSMAGLLRHEGYGADIIGPVLKLINKLRCQPPLADKEMDTIVQSVSRYPTKFDSDTLIPLGVTEPKWISAKTILEQKEPPLTWVWQGYLALGLMTLLSARPKTGKTTLLFHLLKSLFSNHSFLEGSTCLPGKVLLLSEESNGLLRPRFQRLGLNRDDFWVLRRPMVRDWKEAIGMMALAANKGARFIIVDTLAVFWGVSDENDASVIIKALTPLQQLAQEQQVAILLIHHLRKSEGDEGNAHRGSGALVGAVDIAIEMRRVPHDSSRRMLQTLSRLDETPPEVLIALEGDTYKFLGNPAEVSFQEVSTQVLAVVPGPGEPPITREELRQRLDSKPSDTLLKEVLRDLEQEKGLEKTGAGKKGDPFRYCRVSLRDLTGQVGEIPERINTERDSISFNGVQNT